MAISFTNLSGTRENLDKTIRDLLQDNWTASNITGTITPQFESDTESADYMARSDNSSVNHIMIQFNSRTRYNTDDLDFNGDDKHTWMQSLIITIQGESLTVMTQMEDEVNRILWTYAPNSGTRLNKSDGAASEAAWFEDTEITFERLEPEGDAIDQYPTCEGELKIIYFKRKT